MTKHSVRMAYKTEFGIAYEAEIESFIESRQAQDLTGQVKLLVTSPPFPLIKPKKYGNRQGEDYLDWLSRIFESVSSWLRPDGSLVVEIGNSWDAGQPTMSTLPLRSLMSIADSCGLYVCQQFICNNPARLPGPAQWVTVKRYRVKDTYTHVWWFSKDPWIDADNSRVLQPYSPRMKKLLRDQRYNHGVRPSEHTINEESFLRDNGGAIPSNMLSFANTSDASEYREWCKKRGLRGHPARMPRALPQFFIDYLTDEGDLVVDCFGGSNTLGSVAEQSGRNWVTIEREADYLVGSMGRFSGGGYALRAHNSPYSELVSLL